MVIKSSNKTKIVAVKCLECNICVKECKFLQDNGAPKKIAQEFISQQNKISPYHCSLCRLCTEVCPVEVNPAAMFFEHRLSRVAREAVYLRPYRGLLNYEKIGRSWWLNKYLLPDRCETIFFPGCALPATRSGRVVEVIKILQSLIPDLGVVLDCCTKPSHDLGRIEFFESSFKKIIIILKKFNINQVIVACPNCYRMFKEYGQGLDVITVYEILATRAPVCAEDGSGLVTIHDPCGVRFVTDVHVAVRKIVLRSGITISEMKHSGSHTVCCGEGGSVGFVKPEYANTWRETRRVESSCRRVISYCAGCCNLLGKKMPASHVLDLIFEPAETMMGREKITGWPFTYWHRFWLKMKLCKLIKTKICSTRAKLLS